MGVTQDDILEGEARGNPNPYRRFGRGRRAVGCFVGEYCGRGSRRRRQLFGLACTWRRPGSFVGLALDRFRRLRLDLQERDGDLHAMGGYLAARLRTRWIGVNTNEVFFRDTAHGLITWASATVLSATFWRGGNPHRRRGRDGGRCCVRAGRAEREPFARL